ncbi:DNA adenine methylase [Algoriphagus chordae]|uniref:site-specific DNA-methyltransferase (adenine-specific) n=1 Tax=Algoriphagus chordae TaxID=237019 RepID=A0A2W7QEH2_9BACT|nr:DNA adenine methylase [Algoriphagus chordae]PZX46928.1 adenine-specific DNA-methyltransferase [Algoriphagus chordae]
MRFIGNKELITTAIIDLLEEKGLVCMQRNLFNQDKKVENNLTFFDAFCGTGAVADSVKSKFNLVVNDMIKWSVIYTNGRLVSPDCTFEKLGFDPFEFFNSNSETRQNFFYKNYSPGGSERMYFSPENAGRIDYFRETIEQWKNQELINNSEYSFLLASLIESISFVSNTAGVYGAFLKHWDPRAKKPIIFQRVESNNSKHLGITTLNGKIEDLIENVECDILYLDPPYTQNQYGTQYHILQTLVLDDSPSISPITGSRPTTPMRSDWSKDYKSHILFDKIIAKTKAKHIIFSYSVDGFLSKSFIEASLKRYGKVETYKCKKISYSKYTNFKSRRGKEHFEYLFYVEKKDELEVKYESPLNYIGSKAKMIEEIKCYFPKRYSNFVDAFGGGFNVGINSKSNHTVYNELNHFVKDLVESFKINDTYQYLLYMRRIIKKYDLKKQDSDSYIKARNYYNSLPFEKRDPKLLYTIILYGFNQQIRFNGDHGFNNPVGMRWFNDKVLEKMISFSRIVKEKNIEFKNSDYSELNDVINNNSFVYLDPPYRLTTGAYNDGKRGFNGWGIEEERRLFEFVDSLNDKSICFMISYVMEHKGKTNNELKKWIESKGYRLIKVNDVPGIQRKEVLIVNYDNNGNTSLYNKEQVSKGRAVPRPLETSYIG